MESIENFANRPEILDISKKYRIYVTLFVANAIISISLISISIFLLNHNFQLLLVGIIIFLFSVPFMILMSRLDKKYRSLESEFIESNFQNKDIGKLMFSLSGKTTNPDKLKWKKLGFLSRLIAGNIDRLRINITNHNISQEFISILSETKYNFENEPVEVLDLISLLKKSCDSIGLNLKINRMIDNSDLKGDFVRYLEPYEFELPFETSKLTLAISIFEFQWNLMLGDENELNFENIRKLKIQLLNNMKQYIKNGNRA